MSFIEKIKEFILGIDKPVRLYFYFSVFDTLVGLVGMLVYGILTSTDGPFWIRNQYIGIWLLLLVTLYGIISIYLETKHMKRERGAKFYYELAFFLPTTVISLVMSVYFGISGKIDSTIWSVYICAVSFTNCYIVFLKTKRIDNEQSGSEPGEETVLTEGSNEDRNPRLLSAINISLKIASLVILCFVLNGAIEIGAGKIK